MGDQRAEPASRGLAGGGGGGGVCACKAKRTKCMHDDETSRHGQLSLSLSPPLRFPTLTPLVFSFSFSFFSLLMSQIEIIIERPKRIEENNRNCPWNEHEELRDSE